MKGHIMPQYPAKDVALPSELESTSRCYQVFHIEEIIPLYPSTSPTPRFGYVPLVVCTSGEGLLVGKEAKIRKSKVVVIFSAAQIHLFAQRGAMSLLCTVPGKGRQAADLDPSCPSASQDDRVNVGMPASRWTREKCFHKIEFFWCDVTTHFLLL
ncbi:uncharacterized protein CIMG_12474 [Coccidioides immitis RS]|uniref:Uncharacterized protein n=1 Tax=Coccidioides immitis (strain RS) TaxID=246410 RepID=A0A0D8JVB0_COCIM|nr:uncharacterized protein CIMG_12474 [Coccidioides immitis RS]KJF61232.1 hypothetical protein CIMG_12474 [Coccidioides immitis RS]